MGIVSGLKSHVYEDRLKELGLQTLEERRHQADMHRRPPGPSNMVPKEN